MIEDIRNIMKDWFAFELTNRQVEDYLMENPLQYFDTIEREDYADYLGRKITGMSFPRNGDSDKYKIDFYKKLKVNSSKLGYIWDNAT